MNLRGFPDLRVPWFWTAPTAEQLGGAPAHWEWSPGKQAFCLKHDQDDVDVKRAVYEHVNRRMGLNWGCHLNQQA